jgi:cell shape-determining protein MreC
MKMNYRPKNKPNLQTRFRAISIFVFFVFLSGLAFLFPNFTKNTFYTISRPLWLGSSFVGRSVNGIKEFFSFKNGLVNENLSLKDELAALKLKEIDYDTLLKENQDLKTQLGRTDSPHRTLARILSKPPSSPYDIFIIDAGAIQGITEGSKVYISDSIIVGLVGNVTSKTSEVSLFSTNGRKQESVSQRTGTSFTLVGKGGGNFGLEVPKDTDIMWGDVFTYPGLSQSVLASVYYIDTNSQSSFKTIYLRAPINVFSSKDVFIQNQ